MTLADLRTVYEEVVEKQKAKDFLYHNYLHLKQNSSKQEALVAILQSGIDSYNQGQLEDAYSIFCKAIDFEADADAYHNRGTVCMDLGNLRHAIHDFTAAIMFVPDYSPPYTNRGLCIAQILADNGVMNNPLYSDIKNFAKTDLAKAVELGNAGARQYLNAMG